MVWRANGKGWMAMATEAKAGPVRQSWEFTYRAAEVLASTKKRVEHHRAREAWWMTEQDQAETALKAKGFEYRASQMSYDDRMVIVGDPQLAARAHECQDKVSEHRAKQREYGSWIRALEGKVTTEPDSTLTLRIEDVVFFGL